MNSYTIAHEIAQDYYTANLPKGLKLDPTVLTALRGHLPATTPNVQQITLQRWIGAVALACFLRERYWRGIR